MNPSPVIKSLFDQLKSHTLIGAKADLARARERHPILVAFDTAESLVAAIGRRAPLEHGTKDELVAALVIEAQRGANSLQEVLLQGFLPRLERICLQGEALIQDRDVLEPLLTEAFAEAVAAYPGPKVQPGATTFLIRATTRRFLASVRQTHDLETPLVPVGLNVFDPEELDSWSDLPLDTGAPVLAANDPCGYTDEATVMHEESVEELVARRNPHLRGRELKRTCRRLRDQRNLGLEFLRRALPALGLAPGREAPNGGQR